MLFDLISGESLYDRILNKIMEEIQSQTEALKNLLMADNPSAPVYSRLDTMETLRNKNGYLSVLLRIPALNVEEIQTTMDNPYKDGANVNALLGKVGNAPFDMYAIVDELK